LFWGLLHIVDVRCTADVSEKIYAPTFTVDVTRDGKYFCKLFFQAKGLVEATAANWTKQKGKPKNVVKTANFQDSKIIGTWKQIGWINAKTFFYMK